MSVTARRVRNCTRFTARRISAVSSSAVCSAPFTTGASPRASISLALAARAHAFLAGRAYVTPQDVKSMAHDVMRHRLLLSYEAEAREVRAEDVITRILDHVEVP
jgi:MoxR-like ATPase